MPTAEEWAKRRGKCMIHARIGGLKAKANLAIQG